MIYMFGVIFVLGVVVAIIKADPVNEGSKKTWKPKKKSWWFTNHNWNGPIGMPMI